MLGGVNYPNNSIIQFDSIHYTSDHCHSLLCTTDRVPCCSYPHVNGNWYNVQPNGSFVHVPTNQNDYYQSRENDGTVRLIRQVDTTQLNDASYCCQLLDVTSTMQTLCVTIGTQNSRSTPIDTSHIMHDIVFVHSSILSWCVAVIRWSVSTHQQCSRAERHIRNT